MHRNAFKFLLEWKESVARKPLILRGARQVGKTWLMKKFGADQFKNCVYINFDEDKTVKNIFANDYNVNRIVISLELLYNQPIIAEDTLIILDEVQEAPRAVTALKYFRENAPELHIIAAGSLLGVASLEGTGFPVGKVTFLDLYPMTFSEFLLATGNERFINLLASQDWSTVTTFKEHYIELLKQYYFVGGMPEAVATFVTEKNYTKVRKVQNDLLESYVNDFAKHAPNNLVSRIRLVWNSIPVQLAKENRKFVYGALREKARAKDFELAIQWLKDAGLIHKAMRVKKGAVPLAAYENSSFKMFSLDVGLLGAMSGLDAKSIIEGNKIFVEFKGALTEQFIMQQLLADCSVKPYYWSADNSSGEVDFVCQFEQNVVPIEVKAEENLKSKSLIAFAKKYHLSLVVRCSMSNYRVDHISLSGDKPFDGQFINLPLYAISQFNKTAIIDK